MVQRILDNFPPELPAIDYANLQLKICLESCAISFLLQSTDQTLQAAEYFAWMPKDGEEPANIISYLKQKSKLFNLNEANTTVYFRTEDVMFLPSELRQNVRLLLQTQFGFKLNEDYLQKNINDKMVVGWKINSIWAEQFAAQFPSHTGQSSLSNLFALATIDAPDTIYLAFGNGLVELIAVFGQQLQLAKCFTYNTIEDLHYHLLNICKQLKVAPNEVQLKVQGFVEKDSSLFRSLQTFFKDVQTMDATTENWSNMLKVLPAHYFTGLIQAK